MNLSRRSFTVLLMALVLLGSMPAVNQQAYAATTVSQSAHAKLPGTIALLIGSHRAIVNNAFTVIDAVSPLTTPIVQNSRTLVPLRFVSEKLGATVTWDAQSRSARVSLGATNLWMQVDNRVITRDDRQVTLDVAPTVANGRTFVPLRAISESFGKQVFYNRDLIVISDRITLDAVSDREIITEIIDWFRTGQIPAWDQGKAAMTLQQLAALDASVVLVHGYDASGEVVTQGSGFALGNSLFATCLHVLQDATYHKIVDDAGNTYEVAGAVSYSEDYDLAIIRTKNPNSLPALPLGNLASVSKGDNVVTIGSPLGLQNTITQGIVSNIHTVEGVNLIQISAQLAPGSSGGPALNTYGEVIGVAAAGIEATDFNFIVPVDYLLPMLTPLRGKALTDIPVITIPAGGSGTEPSGGGSGSTNPGTTVPVTGLLAPTKNISLAFQPSDIALHPTEPIAYLTDKGTQTVHAVNWETNKSSKLTFDYMPERVVFANGELYVTLVHREHSSYWWEEDQTGSIVIIDPASFSVKATMTIKLDPFDIVVDKQGYIYVASGSGQWTNLESYSRATLTKVSSIGIRQRSYIELSPTLNRIYAVDTDSSPRDMSYFTFGSGKLLEEKDSPYHGDYKMSINFVLSPDGSYVFNGSGLILYPTLTYAGELGYSFMDIAFNVGQNEFYTSVEGGMIGIHAYDTFEPIGKLEISGNAARIFSRDNSLLALRQDNGRYYLSFYALP